MTLELQVNTTDRQLRENLSSVRALGIPELKLCETHDRVLAIVGSGPSLRESWTHIPPDCDVMALNGAYRFLVEREREPTFFALLDAREVNVNFLSRCSDSTCHLIASQAHPVIFDALESYKTVAFHLNTPTTHAVFPEAELYVGGGGTVGMTAMGLAVSMGYRKVILYGYDSSFSGEERHAQAQVQNADQDTLDVWVQDRKYRTTHAMASQALDFFPFYDAIREVAQDFEIHLVGSGLFYDYIATNNHPASRERELSKYLETYRHDDYGMAESRREPLSRLVTQFSGESWLDVSTGRGELMEMARGAGFTTVKGTETVPALCNDDVPRAILPQLPFASGSFDVVSLIEVIEHLLPDDIEPSLLELTRVARKHILISAATLAHWYGGVNLHPSSRSEEDWESLFRSIWGERVKKVEPLGLSPCWRVDF